MNGSTRRQPGERRLSRGRSQSTMSGMKFVRRIARPRTGSGSMSSLGLKKSSAPLNRSRNTNGLLNTASTLLIMLRTFGAVVPASSSAPPEVALTKRCQAFMGIENIEPFCHSKTCLLASPSCQTSVVPRPSTTRKISSYMCLSGLSAPAGALPGRERQVLHFADPDAAEHGNALGLHEGVVGSRLLPELAEPGLAR